MPFRSASITVGSTPVALASNSSGSNAQASVLVMNRAGNGSGIVYLGDAQVTTASGLPLASNTTQQINLGGVGVLYGVAAAGESQTIRIIEIV